MTDSLIKLTRGLLKNGLRFQYQKHAGKPGTLQVVTIEVTHRCISRCIMCNIWKTPYDRPELSATDWIDLLSSSLFFDLRELDLTGGEPFLRKDLVDLCLGVSELKQNHCKSLRSIIIPTNGFLTDPILASVEKILPALKSKAIDLIISCSIDAIGELHDKVRNYDGAWSKVQETIKGLKGIRKDFPNLILGAKTTVLPMNVHELGKIAQYADENDLFTIISPRIIAPNRYMNTDLENSLVFNQEEITAMIRFFENQQFKWRYHRKKLVRYLKTGTMKKLCSCGFNYIFIRSTGDLFFCPLMDVGIGNIKEAPVKELLLSRKASQLRRKMGKSPECHRCTEPGLERYALPYHGFAYLSLLLQMGKTDFLELHHHLGLDKYLDS